MVERAVRTPRARKPRAGLRITDLMLARARQKPAVASAPFAPPQHPPGVLPKGERGIAQDEAFTEAFTWANAAITSAYAEGQAWLGYAELSLLAQRAEYRVISEEIASEMTREWIELKSIGDDDKTDKIKALEDAIDRLKVRKIFHKACEHDGFYGRGHIYIEACDRDDHNELKTPIGDGHEALSQIKINKGTIKALRNIEPQWVYPTGYDSTDPLSPNWYRPENWFVMGKEVHRSRLLTIVGREVPDLLKPAYSFGGLSMTQMVKPYVDNWLRTRQSVADIIHAFSVFVLTTNVGAGTLQPGGEDLFRRIDLFNLCRDNRGLMVLNAEEKEEFQNVAAPLGTLDQLQAQSQEHMAAVSRIPIVKLLGIQPAGLNASSEGELKAFYDWIAAFQEALFRDPLTTVIDFIQLSEFGEIDPEITFEFKPLYQMEADTEAEIAAKEAQTDEIYFNIGAVSDIEIRKRLANDPASPYQGLDLDETPPPPPPEMPGAEQPGAPGAPPGNTVDKPTLYQGRLEAA